MEILSPIADIVSILGAVFALFAWLQGRRLQAEFQREQQRQNKKVTVILQHGAQRLELPVELRRAELTRAEILGRIGMIPMKQKKERFSISFLNKPEFLLLINQVITGNDEAILIIPCTQEEIDQFDVKL